VIPWLFVELHHRVEVLNCHVFLVHDQITARRLTFPLASVALCVECLLAIVGMLTLLKWQRSTSLAFPNGINVGTAVKKATGPLAVFFRATSNNAGRTAFRFPRLL